MEDQVCPQCRTTKYRNPSLKLLVNVCGHSLCESCVDLMFLKGAGSCPECGVLLKRNNFRAQIFEDLTVEKEVDIRKKILKDYNKKEEDFETVNDYNDYLEEIENIIFNLVNGIDVEETQKKIERYRRENKELIFRNKLKVGRSEMELDELIEIERENQEARKQETIKTEMESKMKKMLAKEALIDELMFSETNAKSIVKSFKERSTADSEAVEEYKEPPVRASHFSTGVKFGRSFDFAPVKIEEAPLYNYTEPVVWYNGPDPPEVNNYSEYLKHIRKETIEERAGGHNSLININRILQDAVSGLYFSVKSS